MKALRNYLDKIKPNFEAFRLPQGCKPLRQSAFFHGNPYSADSSLKRFQYYLHNL